MAIIESVKARQIFDSRGNPTVEVEICCSDGTFASAAVPHGASTGLYEALELRDGGSDYLGKGVLKAVDNVNSIIGPALVGKDPREQTELDNFIVHQLDGTKNEWGWCKQKLGADAILAVSLAICKAGASVKKIPLYRHIANLAGNTQLVLPVPAFNVINGGSHAGNKLAIKELMILPTGASSFKEAMKMGVEVYHNLKSVIRNKYGQDATNVVDEGGFAPNIQENKEGLELLKTAIEKAGYTGKVVIGMDVSASEFYGEKDQIYDLNFKEENNDGSQKISGDSLKNVYKSFVSEYPIVSIENPFDQDDWVHYAKMAEEIGEQLQIVGADLLVTNTIRIAKAIAEKSCNALLLKVNQIGSVTESIEAVKLSKSAGWGVMTGHRRGETEDTFIADLAVGLSTGQIKSGAPCRSEGVANYNQLLRIEEELGVDALYAGLKFRAPMELLMNPLHEDFLFVDDYPVINQDCVTFSLDDFLFDDEEPVIDNANLLGSFDNWLACGEHHKTVEPNQSDGAENLIRSGDNGIEDVSDAPPLVQDPTLDGENEGVNSRSEIVEPNQSDGAENLIRSGHNNGMEDAIEDVSDVPPLVQDPTLDAENEGVNSRSEIEAHGGEADGDVNVNTQRNILLITGAAAAGQDGFPDTNQTDGTNGGMEEIHTASGEGLRRNLDAGSVEILRLPVDFNGNAELDGFQQFDIATAEGLRNAVNACKDWLPRHLLAALLTNARLFAVDSSEVDDTTFKQAGAGVVIVLVNAEFQKVRVSQNLYSSRVPAIELIEHQPFRRTFGGIGITCHIFGGNKWRRKRFNLDNEEFHVLQWLPPDRSISVARRVRETDDHSIRSCIDRAMQLEGLTDDEKASAADVMRSEVNRVIFMSFGNNESVQLIWLRKQIARQQ